MWSLSPTYMKSHRQINHENLIAIHLSNSRARSLFIRVVHYLKVIPGQYSAELSTHSYLLLLANSVQKWKNSLFPVFLMKTDQKELTSCCSQFSMASG